MKINKNHILTLVMLLILPLVACSAGGTSTYTPLTPANEYTTFNESFISMPLESSVIITVYVMNLINQDELSYPITFQADKSGVVSFNPESCYFDGTQAIPSCSTTMSSIGVGSTNVNIVSTVGYHGAPLHVVVTN